MMTTPNNVYSWYPEKEATEEIKQRSSIDYNMAGKWYRGYDDKLASFPYEDTSLYTGLAYNIFSRDFLEWFFEDVKTQGNFKYIFHANYERAC